MPRKVIGKKLEKVVSTTLSVDDFILLEKARELYNKNLISHLQFRTCSNRWWNVGQKRLERMSKKQKAQLRSILFKLPIILIQGEKNKIASTHDGCTHRDLKVKDILIDPGSGHELFLGIKSKIKDATRRGEVLREKWQSNGISYTKTN